MLRESAQSTGDTLDLLFIRKPEIGTGGVPEGDKLVEFVEANLKGDDFARRDAQTKIRRALGDAGFVDACAILASFNAVVKIADGTGIPLEKTKEIATKDIRAALSIDEMMT